MEGKIITCCGDCVHYDWKKHKCKNGYNDDTNPEKHFYSDCKTLEDLEEHDAKVRADAIEEFARAYEHVELIGCEKCKHLDDDIHCWRCVAEQLKEQK